MAGEELPSWSNGESYANLEAMADDDFSTFLDLENLDFNLSSLDNNTTNNNSVSTSYDASHSAAQLDNPYSQYQWAATQQYPPHHSIPPTPNSSEMYPNSYHGPTGAGQAYHDQQSYHHKDSSFTPLTSPHFVEHGTSVHDYGMPDRNGMSPLTSPAIYAQHTSGGGSIPSLTAESSMTGSPIDLDYHDTATDSALEERPRKTRKKDSTEKQTKQLAVRKRKGSVAGIKVVAKGLASGKVTAHAASNPPSVSPQPQTDFSMPPPPLPLSARSSPYIHPTSSNSKTGLPPATPASLMRLAKQQLMHSPNAMSPSQRTPQSPATEALGLGMEELTLPEAAAPPVALLRSNSVRSTPAILPKVPNGAAPIAPSPRPAPFGNTSKNPAGRGGSRKRHSVGGSLLVSPAILPRIISPNIAPLSQDGSKTPAVMANEETTAQLLAKRSNYQNLVEGTTVPGMNYPLELSTNLTSKRTSHKIAEQGRRNRINNALQEMQTLLPASAALGAGSPTGDASGSGSGGDAGGAAAASKSPATPAQQANSKAATVELAIEYIKNLRAELDAANQARSAKEAELEALRQKLGETAKS